MRMWIKYLRYYLLISLVVFSASDCIGQDISSDLVLYYSFDQIKADTVQDDSGNDKFGLLKGSARASTGFEGQALLCLNKADYLVAPDNINSGMSSFTFSTWVRFISLKNATRFFDWGSGSDGTNNFIAFIPSYGGDSEYMTLRFRPASGTAYNITSVKKCPVGSWAHVAVTYEWNGSSGSATIYLNGEKVGSGSSIPYNPSTFLGTTTDNYFGYSRWAQDANGFSGLFDELRVYSRALNEVDIINLAGLGELFEQYELLDPGDLSAITEDLTFPTELGDQGVSVSWNTSDNSYISSSGQVTRPEKYDRSVTITATLSYTLNGVRYYREKNFVATVKGMLELPEHVCRWNFEHGTVFTEESSVFVNDRTDAGYTGQLMNDASIRTIGETKQFNVLYLGNEAGYFDMGTEVGEAVYSLKDHTIMGYFRVDGDYTDLGKSGNYFYAFSNTERADVDQTGYIAGRLNVTGHQCTKYFWDNGKEELALGWAAGKNAWHHYAYVQEGTTGKLYIDGSLVKQGDMTQKPAVDIALPGRTGTEYNWLGRSVGLPSDAFLRKTMIYDFNVFSRAIQVGEWTQVFGVSDTLSALNAAYSENPDYRSPELLAEYEYLDLGDLSSLISDINLPDKGTTYQDVRITWYSSQPAVIGTSGIVHRPDYFDYELKLIATLEYDLYSMTKTFDARVLANDGTYFNDDLLVHFDFSNVEDNTVRDIAEKQLTGTLMNGANVVSMGSGRNGIYNVLSLGTDTSYFDLGNEVGKIVSRLDDFTMSAYYFIDEGYTGLLKAGNMLWTFSNSEGIDQEPAGFLMGSLYDQAFYISEGSEEGLQKLSFGKRALKGSWHHLAVTQEGTTARLYVDGVLRASGAISNTLSGSLLKPGVIAAKANWLGRSCKKGEQYLTSALVYDFRIYSRALSGDEIAREECGVIEELPRLETTRREFVADRKIAETSPPEKNYHPDPSYFVLSMKDGSSIDIPVNNLRKLSFPAELTIASMMDGVDSTFSSGDIQKMLFREFKTYTADRENFTFTVYPNPASTYIQIVWPADPGNGELVIFSPEGRIMKRQEVSDGIEIIEIRDYPPGIYIVRTGKYSAKFVKR